MPDVDGSHGCPQQSGHFGHVQHTSLTEPLISAFEVIAFAECAGATIVARDRKAFAHLGNRYERFDAA